MKASLLEPALKNAQNQNVPLVITYCFFQLKTL